MKYGKSQYPKNYIKNLFSDIIYLNSNSFNEKKNLNEGLKILKQNIYSTQHEFLALNTFLMSLSQQIRCQNIHKKILNLFQSLYLHFLF